MTNMKRTFFVVTSGGHDTERHYQDTIESKRSLSEIKQFLSEDKAEDLERIYKGRSFAVWGATPGEGNIQTWHSMSEGDYVLIYRNKRIILIGEVAYKIRNEALAEFFWRRDTDGKTWEYIYFIINEEPLELPMEKLNPYLSYRPDYFPRGFGGISEDKLEEVQQNYGDIYDLVISLGRGYKIKEIQEISEDLAKQVSEEREEYLAEEPKEPSEHDEIQWQLIKIGFSSGNDVWVARNDKSKVFAGDTFGEITLPELPNIGLDPDSSKTVEYIDDVWLRGKRVTSAFEVEHSTSIYSGILRLADLKILQPNVVFPLYVVAPSRRKAKVFQELKRPTFSNDYLRMDQAVKFISYEHVRDVSESYVEKGLQVPEKVFEKISEPAST